jgi:hypothetical protein
MSQGQALRSARPKSRTSCGFCEGTHRHAYHLLPWETWLPHGQ